MLAYEEGKLIRATLRKSNTFDKCVASPEVLRELFLLIERAYGITNESMTGEYHTLNSWTKLLTKVGVVW